MAKGAVTMAMTAEGSVDDSNDGSVVERSADPTPTLPPDESSTAPFTRHCDSDSS